MKGEEMRVPSFSSSGETLLREYGLYHLTRLKADKDLKDMAADWEKCQTRLSDKLDAQHAAEAASMTAMAVRDGADSDLDDVMRAFGLALLQEANNNRKSPIFKNYFPEGWTAVVSAPLEGEVQKVQIILSKLAEEQDEAIASHAGPIQSSLDKLTAAMDAHRSAMDAESQAYGLVQTEKLHWFDAYKLDHKALLFKFYKTPKKADTYFKKTTRAKKAKAPTPPATA